MLVAIIIAAVFVVIGVIVFYIGMRKARLKNLVAKTQTSDIAGLVGGEFAEIKGTVECDSPLKTPYGQQDCVYYYHRRERRERRRSSSSSTRTTWRTVASDKSTTPFRLRDGTGAVEVRPLRAKIDAPRVLEDYVRPGDDMDGVVGGVVKVIGALSGTGQERIRESAIVVGSRVYVLGDVIREGENFHLGKGMSKVFFISHKSEEELLSSLSRWAIGLKALGVLAAALGIAIMILYFALRGSA
jgi:hypothetical protein